MQTKTLVRANVFCTRLKALQKKNDLTSRALATELGVSEPTVSQWRAGRHMPDQQLWAKIAELLGVEANDLFFARTEDSLGELKLSSPDTLNEPPAGYPARQTMRMPPRGYVDPPSVAEEKMKVKLLDYCQRYIEAAAERGGLPIAELSIKKFLRVEDFDYLDDSKTITGMKDES